MNKIIFAVVMLFTSTNVCRAEWLPATSISQIDYSRIEKISNGVLKYWAKQNISKEFYSKYFTKTKYKFSDMSHLLFKKEVKCNEQLIRVTSMVAYTKKGLVIDSYDNQYTSFEDVIPESVGEGELQLVCTYQRTADSVIN